MEAACPHAAASSNFEFFHSSPGHTGMDHFARQSLNPHFPILSPPRLERILGRLGLACRGRGAVPLVSLTQGGGRGCTVTLPVPWGCNPWPLQGQSRSPCGIAVPPCPAK